MFILRRECRFLEPGCAGEGRCSVPNLVDTWVLSCFSPVWLFVTLPSPPGSSVHGILKARILEWVAISYSRGFFRARVCLLHWQVGSLPRAQPGKPGSYLGEGKNHCQGHMKFLTHPESLQGDKMNKSCAGHARLHGASWFSEPVCTPGLEGIEEQSYPLKMVWILGRKTHPGLLPILLLCILIKKQFCCSLHAPTH